MAQDSPSQSCPPAPATCCQCVCEHPALCSWICSLQEHRPNTWGFSIAEVSGALFGTVVLEAAPVRGFLLWAVQQMNMPKTVSLQPARGEWRGQDVFSSSLPAS